MNILVVTYSSNLNGGANRSLLMVLEHMKQTYNHHFHVIVPSKGVLCDELDRIQISWEIHNYHAIGMVNPSNLKGLARFFKNSINMTRNDFYAKKSYVNLEKRGFDLVYLNNNGSVYGARLAQMLKLPYVWHFRGEIYDEARYLKRVKTLLQGCDRFIAISLDMKKLYQKNRAFDKKRIEVVYNGIALTSCVLSDHSRKNGFHLVQCGRIASEKCQLDAVRAIERIVNHHQDVFLHIVGVGYGVDGTAYEKMIRKYVCEHNLEKNVLFEGYRDDMNTFRGGMNCELVCSVREPFGRVTIEGLRSKLVVIGANTGGTAEIIEDGKTGLLYEQGNIDDLATKICAVYEDSDFELRLANEGFDFSQSHFLPEETVDAINHIFQEVKVK